MAERSTNSPGENLIDDESLGVDPTGRSAWMRAVTRWTQSGAEDRTAMFDYGEMAERSKALDWNSSNIFTGVPGFESLSLRHMQKTPSH